MEPDSHTPPVGGPGVDSEVGLDVLKLDTLAKKLFNKGLAPSTTRTYASSKQRYLIFCHTYNIPPLPLSEIKLYRYVSYLSAQQLKYQSIKCYLSAIRHLQISHGFADPFSPGVFPRLEYVLKEFVVLLPQHLPSSNCQLLLIYFAECIECGQG